MPLDRFRHHGLITVQDVTKVASPGQAYMAVRLAILSPFDEVEVKVVRGTQPCNQPVLAKYYGADGQRHDAGVIQAVRAFKGNCSVRLIDVLKLLKQQRPEQPVKREHADDGRGDKLSPDRETLY